MDINNLCLGCMHPRTTSGRCPICGFDETEHSQKDNPRVLPLRTILAGKYLLGRVLGEGGFGITYLAWNLAEECVVAIKEYFPSDLATRDTTRNYTTTLSIMSGDRKDMFQKGLRSFQKEAENLARLGSVEGVVHVLEHFFENNTAYLVMDYVEGTNLREVLKKEGIPMEEERVLRLMRPLTKALVQVHESGIVHRDISPDNIILGENDKITLIDFGAARSSFGDITKSMTILLKQGYAPPEQYQTRGKQGSWTDIYALSATMYRMMSGKVPMEAIERMVSDDLRPLKYYRNGSSNLRISDHTSKVIAEGMQINSEKRFQNMNAFYYALYGNQMNDSGKQNRTNIQERKKEVEPQNTDSTVYQTSLNRRKFVYAGFLLVLVAIMVSAYAIDKIPVKSGSIKEALSNTKVADISNSKSKSILQDTLLSDVPTVDQHEDGQELMSLEYVKDNMGTTYNHAICGQKSDVENWNTYQLEKQYSSIQGRVVLDYQHRTVNSENTYVEIYGDNRLLYTSPLVTAGMKGEDFSIDISNVDQLKVSIVGKNYIRLVDCYLLVDSETQRPSSAVEAQVEFDQGKIFLGDYDWFDSSSSAGGLVNLGTTIDNIGNTYSRSLGGKSSDTDNWNTYQVEGRFSTMTGRVCLNGDYANTSSKDSTYLMIYCDGQLCYQSQFITAGVNPEDFSIGISNVKEIKVVIRGKNYIRLTDCYFIK